MGKPQLKSAAWFELETIVSRFEEALFEQKRPVIRDYLTGCEVDTMTLLLELISAEAEHRSVHGEIVTSADYSAAYADLFVNAHDKERLIAVFEDVRQRVPSAHNSSGANRLNNIAGLVSSKTSAKPERYQIIERISPDSSDPAES